MTPSHVPALLRETISDVFTTSGDLPARWVDVYNRMLNCFGVEYFQQHQADYWTDLILRKIEDEAVTLLAQQSANQPMDLLPTFQISLSRMWLLSTYEGVRLAHETVAGRNNAKLTELRRRLEMVRVPLAKQEIANDQKIKDVITLVRVGPGDPKPQSYSAKERSTYYPPILLITTTGSAGWRVIDSKTKKAIDISRRDLSDEMLSLFADAPKTRMPPRAPRRARWPRRRA